MKTVYVRTKTKDEARKRAEWLYMILRDCTPVIADLHTSKAQVVTETMVIKYVPKKLHNGRNTMRHCNRVRTIRKNHRKREHQR